MAKDKFIQFRASEEERDMLHQYAKEAAMPVSRYLLSLALRDNGHLPPAGARSGYTIYSGKSRKTPILKDCSLMEVLNELSSRFKSGAWGEKDRYLVKQDEIIILELNYNDAKALF